VSDNFLFLNARFHKGWPVCDMHANTTWPKNIEYFVRFQVLTVASMKMTVFWDVALCSLVADDGGSKHLWNVGQFL
jgi:hypothetical protein